MKPEVLVHTCVRYGNGSVPFRGMCDACTGDPREAAVARALSFLCDALEECELTEDEMHAEPGTFYVRLLAAKSSLECALERPPTDITPVLKAYMDDTLRAE